MGTEGVSRQFRQLTGLDTPPDKKKSKDSSKTEPGPEVEAPAEPGPEVEAPAEED